MVLGNGVENGDGRMIEGVWEKEGHGSYLSVPKSVFCTLSRVVALRYHGISRLLPTLGGLTVGLPVSEE